MAFETVLGQLPAIETLRRALATGRVHHAYRFEGPDGVGKERVAFELAQELVCDRNDAVGRRRVVTTNPGEPPVPQHPDVVLVQRGLYGKLITASEATGISVEQIRRIVLPRAGYPPHEGHGLVFIVRDADELTTSAANALLKTLEEPGPRTHFVLLTSRPHRLLDTVRSRTHAVRFGPLSDEDVTRILGQHGAPTHLVRLAAGSAGRALRLVDTDALEQHQRFVERAFAAMAAPDLTAALALSEERPTERSALAEQLGWLAQAFVDQVRGHLPADPRSAAQAARRHQLVTQAANELERNAQPALVVETLLIRLRAC